MKVTDIKTFAVDCFRTNWVFVKVYTDEGILLGKVTDIYNTGANDIYTVKTLENKEILLPAIKDVIKQVDVQNEKIIVHILKGLL